MEATEPSLHLILLSDLRPGRPPATGARELDKDSLDAFLREAAPAIDLDLAGGRARLEFAEFRDFRPERLAARLPALAALLQIKQQALDLAAGNGSAESLRGALASLNGYPGLVRALDEALHGAPAAPKPAPAAPAAPVPRGGVFDLVDDGAPQDPTPVLAEKAAERLIAAVLGTASSGPLPAALRAAAAKADEAVAPLLLATLRHPRFRALEAAWLGLRWLVRTLDFRKGCRLHVVATDRADLVRSTRDLALPLAADLRSQGKTVCLVVDADFDGGEADLATLAAACAGRSTPLIAGGAVEAAIREAASRLGDVSQAAWNSLREGEASRWLALASNRFVLRNPYGAEGDPVRGLAFEEGAGNPSLGGASLAVAALVAASFVRHGWGVDFAGRDAAAALEPLPLAGSLPLQAELNDAAVQTLSDAGLLPLACRRNSDRVFAAGSLSAHRGPGASFRQTLFAAQVSAGLEPLLAYLDPSRSPEEIARTVQAALDLLGLSEGGAPLFTTTAVAASGNPPALEVAVRPSAGVLRGLSALSFQIPLPLR